MPLSQLDKVPALIVVDMQKGAVGLPTAHSADEVTANNARLARAFRSNGFPVVLVNVAGQAPGRIEMSHNFQLPDDWTELVPELEAHPDDHKVTKHQWGAFHGTSLDHFLRRRGVTQVVLTGIATSIGVESTARNAHDHGYHVALVVDAMTDLDLAAHKHSVEKIFPRLGETATTTEVLSLLERQQAQ
ncbi:isochorismatase family protein [Burkholderia cenocepacia]|uniref:isochorismatase family protein n=1 Tax=Burkholderia cenocepacia TaxID=95486 RepID=UPI0009B3C636|nr:isochorismatase family protein [Burkholderia cenocepacia]MDF0504628.1 isochorismatase family protein [Burkholderia cenocepacia]